MSYADPASGVFSVTPHNSTNFSQNARALYVGSGGTISLVAADGTQATFAGVPSGYVLPVQCKRVNATGTTAANIVGML